MRMCSAGTGSAGTRRWTASWRWRSSRAQFPDENEPIVTVNGLFRPFALVRARAAATWSLSAGAVTLKPFAPLAHDDERELLKDAEEVVRFLWPESSWSGRAIRGDPRERMRE
jgi:hypothetical protein